MHPADPLVRAHDALERLGDSSRSTSDLGVQPGAPPVLEVVELWGDAVLEVRHFAGDVDAVQLGEPRLPGLRPWSTALVVALLVGVGALVLRHATMPEPPRLLDGDAALMEQWDAAEAEERAAKAEAARARAEAAAAAEAAAEAAGEAVPEPAPDPLDALPDPLAEARADYEAEQLKRVQRRIEVDGEDPLAVQADEQPFDVAALEDPAGFVTAEMLPIARQLAPEGRLRRAWVDVLEEVALPDEALTAEVSTLLYTDAVARRSITQRCRALDRLIGEGSASFEHVARHALCLRRKGLLDEAAPFAAKALAVAPDEPADKGQAEDIAGLYRVTAELAALDPARRAEEEAAWQALRTFVIDHLQDAGMLAVADAGIHRVRTAELAGKQDGLVRAAMGLSLFVALLLPIGLIVDERRGRRGGPDFAVAAWSLPEAPFPLVERDGDDLLVALPKHGTACLEEYGEPVYAPEIAGRPRTEDVGGWLRTPLPERGRYLVAIGDRVFVVRRTERAAALPPTAIDEYDWRFAGILAAVLLLGASVAILGTIVDLGPGSEVLTNPPQQTVVLQPQVPDLAEAQGADEGERAADEEGRAGDPNETERKPELHVASRKSDRDREMVNELLADIVGDQISDLGSRESQYEGLLAGSWTTGIPGYGPGAGRWGRGPGGGGPNRGGPAGIGIRCCGTGGPGTDGGRGPWTHEVEKEEHGPTVTTTGPITLSPFDKAAIDRVVKQRLQQIRYCYQKELTKNPALAGKVTIKFVIARDGSVSSATVKSSSLDNVIVEKCIASKFMRMRFPPPKSDGIAVVAYPFVFASTGR